MKLIKEVDRKSMAITYSGRSSDYISPSFGFGCLLDCSYCYMKRHKADGLNYARNYKDILQAINDHVILHNHTVEKPNQTDPVYYTYDISCNEDFALHSKYYKWEKIFEYFRRNKLAKATLATKIIPKNFLTYNPEKKVRIRFSLMPQKISDKLEPNTPKILDRIRAVDTFIKAGYDVHLNFSPVVLYQNWLKDYEELFHLVNDNILNKDIVKAEVIFLTHNINKHAYNIKNDKPGENLLWAPNIQEPKTSGGGGYNIRYKWQYKAEKIEEFKQLHNQIIPWNTIRYIF